MRLSRRQGLQLMLGAAQTVFLGAAGRAPDGAVATSDAYSQTVLGLSGLVAYWRLGQDRVGTGLQDASGNGHDGSYPAAPASFGATELAGAIAVSDGEAVDFGATGYGEVAHDVAFELTRGTLSFYFKAAQAAIDHEHRPLTKNVTGNSAGDFGLQLLSGGVLRLLVQNGTDTVELTTPAGIIEAGVEYHVAVMWDEILIWLMLDGRMVHWTRNDILGAGPWDLTQNTAAWQFARGFDGTLADVVLDEVALYDRRLRWDEIDQLSEWARGLAYDPTPETSEEVGTASAIATALQNNVAPGYHILVQPGTYDFASVGAFTVSGSGAKRRPCVLRARGGAGTVTLQNFEPTLTGRWVVFADMTMQQCENEFNGRYLRMTRILADDLSGANGSDSIANGWMEECKGMFCRVDHCELTDPVNTNPGIMIHLRIDPVTHLEGYGWLVDHNYCHDVLGGTGGREFFAPGQNPDDGLLDMAETVYRNYGENQTSDREFITTKSSLHLYYGNTWLKSFDSDPGENYHRQGSRCWHESEWYEVRTRVLGADNVLIGCHTTEDIRLHTANVTMADQKSGSYSGSPYPQCQDNMLIGVTTGGGGEEILIGFHNTSIGDLHVLRAEAHDCEGVTVDTGWADDTVQSGTAPVPYTAAVKLTTSDVGPSAVDPLVPPGWI